jgi:hypothetical protein
MVLLTNKDASRYKVVTVDLADEKKTLHDLVPEDEEALLGDVTAVHDDKLLLVYTRNVSRASTSRLLALLTFFSRSKTNSMCTRTPANACSVSRKTSSAPSM